MARISIFLALVSALFIWSTDACGIWGQVFCDKCWDGKFSSGTDNYVSNVKVSANCTVKKADNTVIYLWGSDTTNSNGYFETSFSGTSERGKNGEQSFLSAFFINSKFRSGRLPNVVLIGCQIQVDNTGSCPNLAIGDGGITTNGKHGNGWTSNVAIAQYQSGDLADIYIGGADRSNSVPLTPISRPSNCPMAPPPPPGIKGDPHFAGADGSLFDFTGKPGNTYCLISDSHVHVNALYGGRFDQWGDNPSKAMTWIRQLGIMWGQHRIVLEAREGARWQYDEGYMSRMSVDGKEVVLSSEGDSASFANGAIEISWLAANLPSADDLVDVYSVRIANAFILRVTLRPEVELLRTKEDGVVHFNLEFPKVQLSGDAHGVLGQTFRQDHRFKLNKQKLVFSQLLNAEVIPGEDAQGFLDGSEVDYRSTGILNADCRMARFVGDYVRAEKSKPGVQLVSGQAISSMAVGRKMLKTA